MYPESLYQFLFFCKSFLYISNQSYRLKGWVWSVTSSPFQFLLFFWNMFISISTESELQIIYIFRIRIADYLMQCIVVCILESIWVSFIIYFFLGILPDSYEFPTEFSRKFISIFDYKKKKNVLPVENTNLKKKRIDKSHAKIPTLICHISKTHFIKKRTKNFFKNNESQL